jgi:hypothetical protein
MSGRYERATQMELLQGEAFENLFRTFERTAFHLELQDEYRTPEEAGPFNLFLNGRPDDFAWHAPWLRLVQEVTSVGKSMTRARVVTVPHSDYVRWGLAVAPHNIAAGENVRWLRRHLATGIELPADDFWLFDDIRVVFTIFEPGGRFGGGAQTADLHIVEYCRRIHEQVWACAVPHDRYVAGE